MSIESVSIETAQSSMNVRQYKILIVDDSAEDRAIYRRYLSKELFINYEIVEVESGEEGLSELLSFQPDLILLDYLLPDIDGLEFIAELKAQDTKVPPIIMLTGQGNETVAVEVMKSGVEDYLIKGQLTADILLNSVRNVIQQHNLRSRLTKSFQQQQLIAQTALRIRQSVKLTEIIDTAVREVRLLLNCDRVVIYKFEPDMSGSIIAESVKAGWTKSLGFNIVDSCFKGKGTERYDKGNTLAVNNIYEYGFTDCHVRLLESFEVKAHIVCPLLLAPTPSHDNGTLWGLLIAHQCDGVRNWERDEVELLDKLAVQMAIALQQAELIDSLKSELVTRRELETELARLVRVLEASEDYIELADVNGKVIWNNPQLRQLIGVDDRNSDLSISGYYPKWAFDLVYETGIPTAKKEGTWLGETALLTRDGREMPVSQLIIAHRSEIGEVEYVSTVMRNLSLQKETERSLKNQTHELEVTNKELLKVTTLLKKRNQELDRFAYVTSHDLKAPLRAISNLAAWLSEDLEGQIPEENQQQLELMQSRVKRMDGLIQGLLKYSRIGKNNTPITVVNIQDLVKEVANLILPSSFQLIIASQLPVIKTQALPLQQVFSNLIDNAAKYHPKANGKITVSMVEQGEFYQFCVTDDGMGIEPQYHDRIFTIFQTLQSRDSIESTGIGLSIVKKIVESQRGRVWVESQLGEGASFYFTWHKYSHSN